MILLASTQNGVTGMADPSQSLLDLLKISSSANTHHYIAVQLEKMGCLCEPVHGTLSSMYTLFLPSDCKGIPGGLTAFGFPCS
eukprot:11969113-Ditylum_brightwellii.AAC.1